MRTRMTLRSALLGCTVLALAALPAAAQTPKLPTGFQTRINQTTGNVEMQDGQQWVPIGTLDPVGHKFSPTGVAANAAAAATALGVANAALARVANNAGLQALVTTLPRVYRDGFSTPGDGGAAVYTYSASACTAPDNGAQVTAQSGGCWIMDTTAIRPTIEQWGANPSAPDNSGTIQAALSACVGRLGAGNGVFNYGSTLTESCNSDMLEGRGKLNTTWVKTTPGDGLHMSGSYQSFRGMGFVGSTASGDALQLTGASVTGDDFVVRGGFNDLHVLNNSGVKLTNYELLSYANTGELFENTSDIFATGFVINAGTAAGALGGIRLFNHVEAAVLTNGDVLGGAYSFTTDASSNTLGARPAYSRLTNVFLDSSDHGSIISNSYGIDLSQVWISGGRSRTLANGSTTTPSSGLTIVNSSEIVADVTAFNNGIHGVELGAGASHVFVKGRLTSNGASASPADGLHVDAGVSDFVALGITGENLPGVGSTQANPNGNQQRDVVYIELGASDRYTVLGNILTGSADPAGVYDGGTGTNKLVQTVTNAMRSAHILNGSIDGAPVGAVTPSTGAFTTLSASGAFTVGGLATLNGGAQINGAVMGVSGLSMTDSATGGFGSAWGATDLSIGGANASGAGSGRLGLRYDSSGNMAYIGAIAPAYAWEPITFQAAYFQFMSGGSTLGFYQDGNGRVGIGTSSPAFPLDVAGTARATGYQVGSTAGASCSGAPTASYTVTNGIVTHC